MIRNNIPTKADFTGSAIMKGAKDVYTDRRFYEVLTPIADTEINTIQQIENHR